MECQSRFYLTFYDAIEHGIGSIKILKVVGKILAAIIQQFLISITLSSCDGCINVIIHKMCDFLRIAACLDFHGIYTSKRKIGGNY